MTKFLDTPDDALVRLSSIIGPSGYLPIGRSTWYEWRKAGRAPRPIRIGPKIVCYRVGDVKALATQAYDEPNAKAKSK